MYMLARGEEITHQTLISYLYHFYIISPIHFSEGGSSLEMEPWICSIFGFWGYDAPNKKVLQKEQDRVII